MKQRTRMRKCRSFDLPSRMRRNNSNPEGGLILRSYEELNLHLSDSSDASDDNESARLREPDQEWSIPNLLLYQNPETTTSKFKPSYLLQRRKEGLVQHSPTYYYYSTPARRHSLWALLLVTLACYALMSLPTASPPPPPPAATDYYYLNMKDDRPLHMITLMLYLHAYAFAKRASVFAGVCGYPTRSQRRALQLLVELNLDGDLRFDVCPPIEAIVHADPHHVLVEESDLDATYFTPEWMEFMEGHVASSKQQLWQQLLTGGSESIIVPPSSSQRQDHWPKGDND